MARNVELKWRCAALGPIREKALAAGARDAGLLAQTDTFFAAPRARLKLRDFGDGSAELISYRRADEAAARSSDYLRSAVPAQPTLAALEHALEVTGRVVKSRHLLLLGATRIHLDTVEELGQFVELETVVDERGDVAAHGELAEIASLLGLSDDDREAAAYRDLLAAVSTRASARRSD
jgi:predicted adenylyl cyclase CyaB